MSFRLFAITAPGLEPFTTAELASLGITANPPVTFAARGEPKEEIGGVEFDASQADLYRTNLLLRTANRIVYRLGEFTAVSFPELRKKAARLPWETILQPGQPVAVRVTCHKSKLYHSDAVAERVAGAIGDFFGKPAPMKKFNENSRPLPQLILVRFNHDTCTISADTSGELLHRRGYRLETAKAPLRETLAAGLIMASGWDGRSPLLDPFCGSGTLAIEAALYARRIAPGKNRRFAFMDWPGFDKKKWEHQLARANSLEIRSPVTILASDRDAGAIQIARSNAERAGVLDLIQFDCLAVSAIQPPNQAGWVVTNPPYGVRVSPDKDLRDLYARFGDVLRRQCPDWNTGVLCSNDLLIGQMHIPLLEKIHLTNGGLPVSFYRGKVQSL
ncbi:THUMP domain-containing class I SAM-dependent RNA methyltransferase [Leptolinea tardivitalis]|uniref:THUMP domain-containing class I SAM-dependent RNA methyltransferase n=1 Tax=Leptolinea tardivitalis TaxID=229920 RepID=UPI000780AF2C|nr:class I SAM-dependent RNA methyltransferase [Leptolinea tardivitalis]GAP21849.1 predicted N6-adenine-specific DNA methylase [Leptolinea tardivitalis]